MRFVNSVMRKFNDAPLEVGSSVGALPTGFVASLFLYRDGVVEASVSALNVAIPYVSARSMTEGFRERNWKRAALGTTVYTGKIGYDTIRVLYGDTDAFNDLVTDVVVLPAAYGVGKVISALHGRAVCEANGKKTIYVQKEADR